MSERIEQGLSNLSRVKRVRFSARLIRTGLKRADKFDYGNRVTEAQREKAEIRDVPFANLHAVQRGVDPDRVRQYIVDPDSSPERSKYGLLTDMPIVVDYQDKLYLHDGHHRVVAAQMLGEESIKARVVKIGRSAPLRAWERASKP